MTIRWISKILRFAGLLSIVALVPLLASAAPSKKADCCSITPAVGSRKELAQEGILSETGQSQTRSTSRFSGIHTLIEILKYFVAARVALIFLNYFNSRGNYRDGVEVCELCVATALVAVRQVLPSLHLLPEDVSVVLVNNELIFSDKENTGKLPDGVAILKVEFGNAEDLGLFLSASSKPSKLDRVHADGLPVYCELRALRRCYIKKERGYRYLTHGEKVTTQGGEELTNIVLPSGGSIFSRSDSVDLAPSTYALGQFHREVEAASLNCKSLSNAAFFPRQYDPVSFSLVPEAKGNLELCEVAPQVGGGTKQIIALSNGARASRIFCDEASQNVFFVGGETPFTADPLSSALPMELKLLGKAASCSVLEDGRDHLLTVQKPDFETGSSPTEQAFSYSQINGSRYIVPVQVETFATTELGTPCSAQNFLLIYQPNYALHTEIQHGTPLECHKIKRQPLGSIEREALMMELPAKNVWIEVPAGSLLAAPDNNSGDDGVLKLHSYQPSFSTSPTLQVPPLYAVENDTLLGQAALAPSHASEDSGILYQTRDGSQSFNVGYMKTEGFVSGTSFSFVTESSLDSSAKVEYHVAELQSGSALVLSDLIHYNTTRRGVPPFGRALEDELTALHRLRHHLSSQGEDADVAEGLREVKKKIAEANVTAAKLAEYMLNQYAPAGAKAKNVVVNMTYSDKSGQLSVVVRLPVNMRESPTSTGLIQQLHVALSVLGEGALDRHPALLNRTSVYRAALRTIQKVLDSGHCSRCGESKADCSYCRAVMFRDFVTIDIHGLDINKETMPDSGSWGAFRGQDFLLSADTSSGSLLLGVEFDLHSHLLLSDTPPLKHLPHLKDYANTCLNAHIVSMLEQQKDSVSFCPGLNHYTKAILETVHIESLASLMNADEFRDLIIEGCNVRVEDAVAACIEGDGEMLALQRLPEFRGLGRSTIYNYVRSLLSPIRLQNIADELAAALSRLDSFKRTLSVAPTLGAYMKMLTSEAQADASRPLADFLLRGENGNAASAIHLALDSAVAAKGVKPSEGTAFYVGFWTHPIKGLKMLEDILPGTTQGASGQEPTPGEDAEKLRKVQIYARRLRQQKPQQYAAILLRLKWKDGKMPETIEEARDLIDAARERHVAEGILPFMKRISSTSSKLYGDVCTRMGWTTPRLPQSAEEAQASMDALREVRARTGPVNKWLKDLGEPLSQSMTWGQIRAILDKAHDKCQCVRSTGKNRCYIDALKTTEDLIFRLNLLVPATLADFINPDAKEITTEAAAFCTATGVFVSAWQQHQVEAGFEHPNGRMAHLVLLERLKKGGEYLLTGIDEKGVEDSSGYKSKRKALNKLFSVNAAAKVAREPAGIKGAKVAARSLYGGIVNSVGTSAVQVEHFVQAMLSMGAHARRRGRKEMQQLTGLIAALRVSQRFKDCFSQAKNITSRAWYLMHIEGEGLVSRLQKHRLGEELAPATYRLAAQFAGGVFDKAFSTLMATVTTQWEDANAFKHLVAYTPGGGPVRLQEVPPEDFDAAGDA
ncbi:hypothetical protein Emag_000472 [Eimeria magna]